MSEKTLRKWMGSRTGVLHSCMHRADGFLIAGCLLTALLLGIVLVFHRSVGSTVCLMCDGVELRQIAIQDFDQDGYYLIIYSNTGSGHNEAILATDKNETVKAKVFYYKNKPILPIGERYNLISVADGKVTMEAADCQDQICVHHKPIMSERESIICLPHKLVVEIEASGRRTEANLEQRQNTDSDGELLDGVTR